MKYAAIVPLIGGNVLGAMKALNGEKPRYILSYTPFKKNDQLLMNYLNDVQYILLDTVDKFSSQKLDFVNTLCPCAGLSELNPGKNSKVARGDDALQNDWMYITAEYILQNVKPRVFYGENTDNLFSGTGVADKLYEISVKNGYSFSMIKTDARLHGLPQKRERTFYFFWDSNSAPVLEIPTRDYIPLGEFLNDENYIVEEDVDKKEGELKSNYYYKYFSQHHNIDVQELYENRPFTLLEKIIDKNLLDDFETFCKRTRSPKKIMNKIHHVKSKLKAGKEFWDDSPLVVKDYMNAAVTRNLNTIHPLENRYLTIGEWIKMMSLPKEFVSWLPDRRTSYLRLFQNVPLDVAEDIAKVVIKYLEGNFKESGYDYIKQNIIKDNIDLVGKRLHSFF